MRSLVVLYGLNAAQRKIVSDALEGAAKAVYLSDLDDAERAEALRTADAVLAHSTRELRQGEIALLKDVRLLQFITAGIDFVPLAELPAGVRVATNGGAYAEPMAEHALAMTLAAAKRLLVEHAALGRGEFNQFVRNRMLAGGVCGILGFGGIGIATGRLARGIGMQVHAINRRGWRCLGDLHTTHARHAWYDRSGRACANEGGRHSGECRTWRDRRRSSALCATGGVPEFLGLHRCVVD
jgi:glycerate dehydrogenase